MPVRMFSLNDLNGDLDGYCSSSRFDWRLCPHRYGDGRSGSFCRYGFRSHCIWWLDYGDLIPVNTPGVYRFHKGDGENFWWLPDKPEDLIVQLAELATIARKDGMIALEGQEIKNKFLAKGISMLVDGTDGKLIRTSLERENDQMKSRHGAGQGFLRPGQRLPRLWG